MSANIKRDQFDLSDKTVLITGGAGLLGREHAYAVLANNGSVVLADRDQEALEVALDTFPSDVTSRVSLLPLDITSERELSDLVAGFEREGRNIDVLVNNAAINPQVSANLESRDPSRLENYSVDRWNLEISVGLTGAFLCAKHVGSFMARSRGGVILNIASDLSVISPDQRLYAIPGKNLENQPVKPVAYSVVKTGLIGLTRYLATYWPEHQMRCNALSPGGVYIDQPEDFRLSLEKLIPAGRMANRQEYHGAIQFLCSDASAYLNGQNIVMDGGRSVW